MKRRRPLRRLPAAALWVAFAAALALGAVQWLLPWLARRGDLNAVFEGWLRASLPIPVRVERIETEPFSSLRLTRLYSVSAGDEARLRFAAQSVTLSYDPLELLGGRLREVRLEAPRLFLDLDADLSTLAPTPERGVTAPVAASRNAGEDLLPVTVDALALERGELALRLHGHELPLTNLRLEVSRFGKTSGQRFHLSVEALQGQIRAWGGVDVQRSAGAPDRYAFREARVVIDDVDAAALLAWLTSSAELAAWLPAVSVAAGGKLQLEGSFEGTYPERVELSLAVHALDVTGAHERGYAWRDAALGLHLHATVLGDLEAAPFTLSTHASGRLEAGAEPRPEHGEVEIAGEFRRKGSSADQGLLTISPSSARLEGLGELTFSGTVAPLGPDTVPELRGTVSLESVDIGSLLARLPAALRESLAQQTGVTGLEGQGRVTSEWSGDVTRPRCELALELPRTVVHWRGGRTITARANAAVRGLELEPETRSATLERLELRLEGVPAAEAAALLLPLEQAADVQGTLGLTLATNDVRLPTEADVMPLVIDLEWRGVDFTPARLPLGWTGATGSIGVQLSPHWSQRRLDWALRADTAVDEALAGRVYVRLAGEPLTGEAAGSATWDGDHRSLRLQLDELGVHTPLTGPLRGRGIIAVPLGPGATALDLDIEATQIPGARAFRSLVAEPLATMSPLLAEASFTGDVSLAAGITGTIDRPAVQGRLDVGPADFTSGTLALEGLEAAVPFFWGDDTASAVAEPLAGFVRARRVHLPGATLPTTHLEIRLDGNRYHLEPLVVPLHGGQVSIGYACLRLAGAGAPEGSLHVHGDGLDTAAIARAHGWTEVPGTLSFALDPLRLEGSRLESHGTIRWRTLGGELSFSDLTVMNLTQPYAGLRLAEGRVRHLDLRAMGETFHFGVASGILDGTVRDLEIMAGELTRFRLEVGTVRQPNLPQYLNRAAIESIRRVLAGPLGAIEETFFSKFYFRDFGFTAELDGETFRLRGKYRDGDHEYILRGRWFELPRIDIINARPGRDYEWRQIVDNLRAVYEGQ